VPAALEIMDDVTIRCVENYLHTGLPLDAAAILLIEVDGAPEALLAQVEAIAAKYELDIAIFGHAGDGNLHPNILVDKNNTEEMERAEAAVREGRPVLDSAKYRQSVGRHARTLQRPGL
jgi:FAD/FMN-containing dehydrogenase